MSGVLYVFMAIGVGLSSAEAKSTEEKLALRVQRTMAKKFACDEDAVTVTLLPGTSEPMGSRPTVVWFGYRVSGCGKTFYASTRKGYNIVVDDWPLHKRVPIEWRCDDLELTFSYIGRDTRLVEGCGSQATYILTHFVHGKWVANSVQSEPAQ